MWIFRLLVCVSCCLGICVLVNECSGLKEIVKRNKLVNNFDRHGEVFSNFSYSLGEVFKLTPCIFGILYWYSVTGVRSSEIKNMYRTLCEWYIRTRVILDKTLSWVTKTHNIPILVITVYVGYEIIIYSVCFWNDLNVFFVVQYLLDTISENKQISM